MNGIVLGGGGALGAYEIGAIKAMRELGYDYKVVTGTSVGSINGSFLVQKEFDRLEEFWAKITFEDILGHKFKWKNKSRETLIKAPLTGGFSLDGLRNLLEREIDEKKMRESDIKFGLVYTTGLGKYNPVKLENIEDGQVINYVVTSCSAIPFLKKNKLNGKKCYDGYFSENLPINLAAELGATKVVAIDVLKGRHRKVKDKNVKVFTLKPSKKMGFFLNFDNEKILENMKLGYDDVMSNDELKAFIKE